MSDYADYLNALLQNAAGEEPLHSGIGHWRQAVAGGFRLISGRLDAIVAGGGARVTANFVQAEYSQAGGGQVLGVGTDVKFDVSQGNIAYAPATGIFTLLAGTAYELSAHFALNSFSGESPVALIEWVDADTNVVIRAGHPAFVMSVGNTANQNPQPTAAVFIQTADAPRRVKLRMTGGGAAVALSGLSYAMVKAI